MDSIALFLIGLGHNEFKDYSYIFTGLSEVFSTYLKFSMLLSLYIIIPVAGLQLYSFMAPGLYKKEQKRIVFFIVIVCILFYLGCYFFMTVLLPSAWRFFISFQESGVADFEFIPRVKEYLEFSFSFIFFGGLIFQLPSLLLIFFELGFFKAQDILRRRKYYILVILILAGLVTPPDLISQVIVFVPTFFFIEFSLFLCLLLERFRV
jgi:sec-independent protein translocase protein TatC